MSLMMSGIGTAIATAGAGAIAPVITVPGAQTVEWNVTGVTPKNVLEFSGGTSITISGGGTLTLTVEADHGHLYAVPPHEQSISSDNWTAGTPHTWELKFATANTERIALALELTAGWTVLVTVPSDATGAEIATALSGIIPLAGTPVVSTDGSDTVWTLEVDESLVPDNGDRHFEHATISVATSADGKELVAVGTSAQLTALLNSNWLRYQPVDDYLGADTLTVNANDGNGGTDEEDVAITVEFDPLDLAPLVLMGETYSDNGTTPSVADGPVQDWDNAGSLGGSYRQASAGSRPTHKVVNGVKVVRGGGAHCLVSNSVDFTGVTGAVVVLLMKKTASDDGGGYGYFNDETAAGSTHTNWLDGTVIDGFGSTTRNTFTGTNWALWTRYIAKSVSGEWTARIDGAEAFTTGTNTVAFPSTTVLFSGTHVEPVAAGFLDGDIAFFGIFPGTLTSNEILKLEAYLATIQADLEA